jgi:hypothetical protein
MNTDNVWLVFGSYVLITIFGLYVGHLVFVVLMWFLRHRIAKPPTVAKTMTREDAIKSLTMAATLKVDAELLYQQLVTERNTKRKGMAT